MASSHGRGPHAWHGDAEGGDRPSHWFPELWLVVSLSASGRPSVRFPCLWHGEASMASRATSLVAEIIDRIEERPSGTGRPPMPTIKVVEALRFVVRKGMQCRDLWAMAGRACGSTLRRRLDDWRAVALLRRVHAVLVCVVRGT